MDQTVGLFIINYVVMRLCKVENYQKFIEVENLLDISDVVMIGIILVNNIILGRITQVDFNIDKNVLEYNTNI